MNHIIHPDWFLQPFEKGSPAFEAARHKELDRMRWPARKNFLTFPRDRRHYLCESDSIKADVDENRTDRLTPLGACPRPQMELAPCWHPPGDHPMKQASLLASVIVSPALFGAALALGLYNLLLPFLIARLCWLVWRG
jgi:hypothetical protein